MFRLAPYMRIWKKLESYKSLTQASYFPVWISFLWCSSSVNSEPHKPPPKSSQQHTNFKYIAFWRYYYHLCWSLCSWFAVANDTSIYLLKIIEFLRQNPVDRRVSLVLCREDVIVVTRQLTNVFSLPSLTACMHHPDAEAGGLPPWKKTNKIK